MSPNLALGSDLLLEFVGMARHERCGFARNFAGGDGLEDRQYAQKVRKFIGSETKRLPFPPAGRKRHIAVDTDGRLLLVNLPPANGEDAPGARRSAGSGG